MNYFKERFSFYVAMYWDLEVMSPQKMDEVKIFRGFQGTELSTSMAKFICTTYDAI